MKDTATASKRATNLYKNSFASFGAASDHLQGFPDPLLVINLGIAVVPNSPGYPWSVFFYTATVAATDSTTLTARERRSNKPPPPPRLHPSKSAGKAWVTGSAGHHQP
jgi:hypothetical protein